MRNEMPKFKKNIITFMKIKKGLPSICNICDLTGQNQALVATCHNKSSFKQFCRKNIFLYNLTFSVPNYSEGGYIRKMKQI